MTVRSDLEKATGVKAKKNEDAAAFRLRLIEAVSGLDDEDYEALPKTSREWSDEAIKAYDTGRKLEDIPDFPAKDAKGKNKKAVAAKSEKAAKPKKAKAASEGGKGLDFARSILAKDISVSATDLREKVAQAGYEVSDSTLSTGASGFRAAVRA